VCNSRYRSRFESEQGVVVALRRDRTDFNLLEETQEAKMRPHTCFRSEMFALFWDLIENTYRPTYSSIFDFITKGKLFCFFTYCMNVLNPVFNFVFVEPAKVPSSSSRKELGLQVIVQPRTWKTYDEYPGLDPGTKSGVEESLVGETREEYSWFCLGEFSVCQQYSGMFVRIHRLFFFVSWE